MRRYQLSCHEFLPDENTYLSAVSYVNRHTEIDARDVIQLVSPPPGKKLWSVIYLWDEKRAETRL